MKKKLKDYSELKLLKRNSKLEPESFYLLSSESSMRNFYFETERDIKFAHRQIKKHLSGILNIVDYLFTPHGWLLLVVIKSDKEILDYCTSKRGLSKTISTALRQKNVSVIISEFIRYTISSIARFINYKSRRRGTVVRENFCRYIFETVDAASRVMKGMKRFEIDLFGQQQRYKPKVHLWKGAKELLGMDNIFLTTKRMEEGRKGVNFGDILIEVVAIENHVLRKLIDISFLTHNSQINSTISTKITIT